LTKADSDWKKCTLGELGVFSKGSGVTKAEVRESGFPCIRYGEIYTHHGTVVSAYNSFIDGATAHKSQRIEYGDILLAGSGETKEEIGKATAFMFKDEAYAGGDIVIFRPSNSDSTFLAYLLNSQAVISQKASAGKGDAVVHISATDLGKIQIDIPSLSEQLAIAKKLTDIDELIEVLLSEKNKLKDIRLATLQEIFLKKRFGIANLVVESVVLGEVIKEINDGGTPNTAVSDYFGGQINWAVVDDVVDEIYSTKSTLTESGLQNSSAILWPLGTLILTTGATIGKVGIAMVPTATKQGLCGIQFDLAKVNTKFMKYWFQMNTDLLKSLSQGSTIKEVRPPELKKMKVELPDLSYQDRIVDVISDFDLEIANLNSEINKYECIKQGMAHDLLTGKVRLV
jgi:type I restriction enzyme S subunit